MRYEVLFLTVPEITSDESENIKKYFSQSIRDAKGDLLAYDRWGKYRLAYPVRNNEYGVYYLVRFEVAADQAPKLLDALKDVFSFKFEALISKHVFTRLPDKGSLEYKRPESLEDSPQDVNTFLKKNDMSGLLDKKKSEGSAKKESRSSENTAEQQPAKEQEVAQA